MYIYIYIYIVVFIPRCIICGISLFENDYLKCFKINLLPFTFRGNKTKKDD